MICQIWIIHSKLHWNALYIDFSVAQTEPERAANLGRAEALGRWTMNEWTWDVANNNNNNNKNNTTTLRRRRKSTLKCNIIGWFTCKINGCELLFFSPTKKYTTQVAHNVFVSISQVAKFGSPQALHVHEANGRSADQAWVVQIVRLVGQRKDLVGLVDMTCILMVIVKNRPPRRSGKHTHTHTGVMFCNYIL